MSLTWQESLAMFWPYIFVIVAFSVAANVSIEWWREHRRKRRIKYSVLILISKGKQLMPLSLPVGKTATAVLTEFDAAGNVVPAVQPPSYASDNAAVATVAGNQVTAVGVGTANISGLDSGDGQTASDVLTVTDVATSSKLTLTAN